MSRFIFFPQPPSKNYDFPYPAKSYTVYSAPEGLRIGFYMAEEDATILHARAKYEASAKAWENAFQFGEDMDYGERWWAKSLVSFVSRVLFLLVILLT
jgi:hypothetical protein